jgi:hypothetical protein
MWYSNVHSYSCTSLCLRITQGSLLLLNKCLMLNVEVVLFFM